MEHVAFLAKKRKLLAKILSGEKTIESRWYVSRRSPWSGIAPNDIVYFKETGDPITAKARVAKALFFDLRHENLRAVIAEYGQRICLSDQAYENLKEKRYCILIFLKDVEKTTPFEIDKAGFGNMAAWITTRKVASLKR